MSRTAKRHAAIAALAIFVLGPASTQPAEAILLDTKDGTENTTPPRPDPGWGRVATQVECPPRCELSFVYLGNGWFITSLKPVVVKGVKFPASDVEYPIIQKSVVRLGGPKSEVDLLMFRVENPPDFPVIQLHDKVPQRGERVIMIGHGLSRGEPLTVNPRTGWTTVPPSVLRWGTNNVDQNRIFDDMHIFSVRFEVPTSIRATPFEAHAVEGDLGGPVFIENDRNEWVLAGIMHTSTLPKYGGGRTRIVDLSRYREEILERIK